MGEKSGTNFHPNPGVITHPDNSCCAFSYNPVRMRTQTFSFILRRFLQPDQVLKLC